MQRKPTGWDALLAGNHTKEIKLTVDGVPYEGDAVKTVKISGTLYDDFGIGGCCARELTAEFYPSGSPARQAAVSVFLRLRDGDTVTDYIRKGTYYISKRQTDHAKGTLKLTCYDAMLKAERPFTDVFDEYENWPMDPTAAATRIAAAIGVTLDSRTSLDSRFRVSYPVDEDGDMTLREMLSRIAVANAGNWIITDENRLLLVKLNSAPEETHYLVDRIGNAITFGGNRILIQGAARNG